MMKKPKLTKLVLHGLPIEMHDMVRAYHVAEDKYPGGKGCSGGLLGMRFGTTFYSIKWNKGSVSVWVSK